MSVMAISSKPLPKDVLPFHMLSNYEIECLFKNTRREILARLDNPVLLRYLKNQNSVNLNSLQDIDCCYYTEDEPFNWRQLLRTLAISIEAKVLYVFVCIYPNCLRILWLS